MMSRFALAALLLMLPLTAQAAASLCPDAETLVRTPPDAMTGVQADIDRLTLCVERAKLLKQLDEVATQREEMLNKVRNPSNPEMPSGVGGIPALPSAALPPVSGIDTAGLQPGDVRITNAAPAPLAPTMQSLEAPAWKVRKIWGQGASMRAQLSDGKGVLINVRTGDPLPDGATVESISVKGVAISQNGKAEDLSWEQVEETTDKNG